MTNYFVSTHADGRIAPIAIDIVAEDGRSVMFKESIEQIQLRYPNVVVMTTAEFMALQESCLSSAPVRIDREKYVEMLEVLPPLKWRSGCGAETFMMSEFMSGRITGIYCRIGQEYFTFYDVCSLSHDEIVRKCREAACLQ